MSEGSSDTVPKPELTSPKQNTRKVIDTFQSQPRRPDAHGTPISDYARATELPSLTPPRMGIKTKIALAAGAAITTVATLLAASPVGRGLVDPDKSSPGASQPNTEPENKGPGIIDSREASPPVDREIVKIQRGVTKINKFDVVNRDEIRFRRDAIVPTSRLNEPTPPDNRVGWDEIKSINGAEIGNVIFFTITDAPLVVGQAVDEAGQGYYWIKLENVELNSGEKTILYVSLSSKTKNIVQTSGGVPSDPDKDWSGKITVPTVSE